MKVKIKRFIGWTILSFMCLAALAIAGPVAWVLLVLGAVGGLFYLAISLITAES